MITQLDTENGDRDIKAAGGALCLSYTDAANPRLCQAVVFCGDGVKNLDGTGGNFTLRVDLGSQVGSVKTIVVAAGVTRAWLASDIFLVPANIAVAVRVFSPNVADADVDVTAYLLGHDTQVDVSKIAGATVNAATAQLGVNLVNVAGAAVNAATAQLGVNLVNVAGAAVDPTAAQLGTNVVQIAAAAVDPATAQIGANLVNIAGAAVDATAAQLGANVVQVEGQALGAVAGDNFNTYFQNAGVASVNTLDQLNRVVEINLRDTR